MNYFRHGDTVHMALSAQTPALCGADRSGATWTGRASRHRPEMLCAACVAEVKRLARKPAKGAT